MLRGAGEALAECTVASIPALVQLNYADRHAVALSHWKERKRKTRHMRPVRQETISFPFPHFQKPSPKTTSDDRHTGNENQQRKLTSITTKDTLSESYPKWKWERLQKKL